MVFSTNQARQIYVAKQAVDYAKGFPTATTKVGDICLGSTDEEIFFKYMGPDTAMRSDLIKKSLITSATLIHGAHLKKYLHQYDITLSADPVAGQEYLLRINLLGYASLGIENTYQKYGYVRAVSGMTKSKFYCELAKSLAANFSREPFPVYQFFVVASGGDVNTGTESATTYQEVKANTDIAKTLTGTYEKITIREVSGPWHVGTDEDIPQMAQIYTDTIVVQGVETLWGTVTEITDKAKLKERTDSVYRQLADMEYFYMGERADKYRYIGWPKVIFTNYMIDKIGKTPEDFSGATDATGVCILDIHYSYVGSNESVQKSEKDICIIIPSEDTATNASEKLLKQLTAAGVGVYQKKATATEFEYVAPTE